MKYFAIVPLSLSKKPPNAVDSGIIEEKGEWKWKNGEKTDGEKYS